VKLVICLNQTGHFGFGLTLIAGQVGWLMATKFCRQIRSNLRVAGRNAGEVDFDQPGQAGQLVSGAGGNIVTRCSRPLGF